MSQDRVSASQSDALPTPPPRAVRRGGNPRVLIVRTSALGDVSRSVPALVSLRRAMPAAHIDWLVHERYADVIRCHPDLDGTVPFARDRFMVPRVLLPHHLVHAWRWARSLSDRHYDLVIDLQGLTRSALFSRCSRAPRRVGFANTREWTSFGYTHRRHVDASRHTVDRMLALIEAEGIAPAADMRLYVGDEDNAWLDAELRRLDIADGPYLTLAPTARWKCKCWPLDRFVQVARRLLDSGRVGQRVFILAAPSEQPAVRPLLEALGSRAVMPRTSVGQMMAILSRTRLLLCNDSAALHIAVGFNRPIVTIFGPTDPALVGPYQRDDAVVRPPGLGPMTGREYRRHRHDQSLIARVSVEEVWRKVQQQLDARP